MRSVWMKGAGWIAVAMLLGVFPHMSRAQDEAADDQAVSEEAVSAEAIDDAATAGEPLLGEEDLDDLVAPVALYPDALLAQVFVASTFPLDVIKADRFVSDNADVPDEERASLAEAEDWDPSVQVLASGFPTVVQRMAEEIDWTEELGDATLAQTDDVLDAVQRMRTLAMANGTLTSGEEQVVEVEDDQVSIAPADPEVVYVPTYEPAQAFAAPAAGTAPMVVTDGSSFSTGNALATGAIAFGSAMILGEIFDDDDDWDDYWRGPPPMDWDNDAFYPRPGINVDGDVNIDRDRINNIDLGDRTNTIDRDRVNIDRKKIGDIDRDRVDIENDGRWKPDDKRKRDARDKIAAREPGKRTPQKTREADKLKGRGQGGGQAAADPNDARAKLKAANAKRPPGKKDAGRATALKPKAEGKKKTRQAADRGAASAANSKLPANSKAKAAAKKSNAKPAAKARKPAAGKPKVAAKASGKAKPKQAKKPAAKKSPKKASALKKSSGGHKAKAASKRGGKSHGKGRKR